MEKKIKDHFFFFIKKRTLVRTKSYSRLSFVCLVKINRAERIVVSPVLEEQPLVMCFSALLCVAAALGTLRSGRLRPGSMGSPESPTSRLIF